jgi:hypothetical protein
MWATESRFNFCCIPSHPWATGREMSRALDALDALERVMHLTHLTPGKRETLDALDAKLAREPPTQKEPMPKKTLVPGPRRAARKTANPTARSKAGHVGRRSARATVVVEVADGKVLVERGKVVDLLKNSEPVSGEFPILSHLASITHLKMYSDSRVHRLEDRIVDALRIRIHKQLGAIAAADIDLSSLGAPEDLADSMAAVLPASHPFDELIGPFYDTPSLRKWLGLSRQRLNQRVKSHQLLACPLEDGGNVYPTWQFRSNGTVVTGLQDVLSILSEGTNDNWQIALWFSAPSEKLGNVSPKDSLLKGRRVGSVIELARETAARWGR